MTELNTRTLRIKNVTKSSWSPKNTPRALVFAIAGWAMNFNAAANETAKAVCATNEFCSSIKSLTDQQIKAMTGVVWKPGCPVALNDLRAITAKHRTFKGTEATGALVVHYRHASAIQQVLHQLYDANFPIESMIVMEAFNGDDEQSQLANNTSAFNCRPIKGSRAFSQHAYGLAIDINPKQNPFVKRSKDKVGTINREFYDRVASANKPGVVNSQSLPVKAFRQIGWGWGGRWRGDKDYQHFSAANR